MTGGRDQERPQVSPLLPLLRAGPRVLAVASVLQHSLPAPLRMSQLPPGGPHSQVLGPPLSPFIPLSPGVAVTVGEATNP